MSPAASSWSDHLIQILQKRRTRHSLPLPLSRRSKRNPAYDIYLKIIKMTISWPDSQITTCFRNNVSFPQEFLPPFHLPHTCGHPPICVWTKNNITPNWGDFFLFLPLFIYIWSTCLLDFSPKILQSKIVNWNTIYALKWKIHIYLTENFRRGAEVIIQRWWGIQRWQLSHNNNNDSE